ncbi:MAG: hypothetical protein KC413_13800 [Anaerolineales bacterium]|nr:hypothetical protein [Anaerolineales bacterium]
MKQLPQKVQQPQQKGTGALAQNRQGMRSGDEVKRPFHPTTIIQLQQQIGNASVQRLLAARPNQIQRYEGHEHQDLGDRSLDELHQYLQTDEGKAWAKQYGLDPQALTTQIGQDTMQQGGHIRLRNGVALTPGEIISLMGDFYGSWQSLDNAKASEIGSSDRGGGILGVMQQERHGRISGSQANAQYEQITGGRYLQLAQHNDVHFARQNKQEWLRLHEEAIAKARDAAAAHSEDDFQQALLIDAAGGHFLTDAFASGHLFDKSKLMVEITRYLAANPIRAQNPEMQTYLALVDLHGSSDQLVLKNIHDRLNVEGLEISNAKGMRWRTYADNRLRNAAETQHIASLAIFLSRRQIEQTWQGNPPPNAQEVLDLLPDEASIDQATAQAIAYIPEAARQASSLLYRSRGMAPTQFGSILGTIAESNLATIGSPGRERQIDDMLRSSERMGSGPVVAPSFTIASWE